MFTECLSSAKCWAEPHTLCLVAHGLSQEHFIPYFIEEEIEAQEMMRPAQGHRLLSSRVSFRSVPQTSSFADGGRVAGGLWGRVGWCGYPVFHRILTAGQYSWVTVFTCPRPPLYPIHHGPHVHSALGTGHPIGQVPPLPSKCSGA